MCWTNPFHREIYRASSIGDIVQGIGSGNWAITTESQLRRRLRRIRILQGDGGSNPGISVSSVLYCPSNSDPTPVLRSELCFPNRRRTAATFKEADYKDDERNRPGTPRPRVHVDQIISLTCQRWLYVPKALLSLQSEKSQVLRSLVLGNWPSGGTFTASVPSNNNHVLA